ncbi:UV excision repair protein Rad23 [Exophiala aquamarina CBS 119918]|uniref:UV excision repair protein RAD23 n=1 Tax=Exophiala aquamarina CBS 119918 TaxID=1182545 RepID=A0A072PKE7_9EURO|nr:UV excision repair protein Rad23 [Exophiala aquamarina CBS 119918]KEF60341.1 UV excision repair protein Rad23 [Exophiala aquamarina CBS 119918]
MKLSFRDLKQQKFTIEAEPTDTIAQVKEKVAAEKGWEVSQQKLIYSGKVLADANTVESYKIEEKGFIVCMVSKATPAAKAGSPSTPAPSGTASTPAPPAAPQPNPPSAPAAQPSTPSPAQTTAAAADPASSGFNDPSAFLVGNRNESTVREMEAMGFQRADIDRALRAAYFNPDRAIEYLLSGIPENIQAEQRERQQQQQQQQQQTAQTGAQATPASPPPAQAQAAQPAGDEPINLFEAAAQAGQQGRGGGGGAARGAGLGGAAGGNAQQNMDFLRQSPHFQQLRQLVQQQPAMLEPILQQVAEGNPQLAQIIGQNQEQFLQLLAEDIGGDAIGGMGDAGPLPPGATPISVTEEERDAIERLCRLGFSRDQVIQAYFACDKNEELAANFLFEQPDEDEQ